MGFTNAAIYCETNALSALEKDSDQGIRLMKVAVMGAGGVGGYFGALLAKAGHDTTFIARGPHLEAVRRKGLTVQSDVTGEFVVRAPATNDTASIGPVDLVLFTVKMYHNPQAIPAVKPLVGHGTTVLTLQNGVDNGDKLGELLGKEHVMIGSTYIEGVVKEPGVVAQIGTFCRVVFGELEPGVTQRGQRWLEVFREAGWEVELAEDMPAMMWTKFAYIGATAGVCSASQAVYKEMASIPETRQLLAEAMAEIAAVARAKGVQVPDDAVERGLTALETFAPHSRSSMAKDFARGGRVELEGLTGTVVRMGHELGVPTPVNRALYALLKPLAQRAEEAAAQRAR